jgi:hypothetical protein
MAKNKPQRKPAKKCPSLSAKLKFHDVGPKLSQSKFNCVAFNLGMWNIPEDYKRFLLKYNGCRTEPNIFKWRYPPEGKTSSELNRLFGILPGGFDCDHGVDCIAMLLRCRDDLPRFSLPIGFVDDESLLLLFVAGPRHGQVWIKVMADVSGLADSSTTGDEATYRVTKTFTEFLASLHQPVEKDPYHPVAFALDSPRVRGAKLEAILKSLGCKRYRYPGVKSSTPLPLAWHWPKYLATKDVGGPAWVTVEKNCTEGFYPHFEERSVGHKMLLVNVTVSQRPKCLKELAAALGPSAVQLG